MTYDPEHVAQLTKPLAGLREFGLLQFPNLAAQGPDDYSYFPFPARPVADMQAKLDMIFTHLDGMLARYAEFADNWVAENGTYSPPPLFETVWLPLLELRRMFAGTDYPAPPVAGQIVGVKVLPKKWT